MYENRQRELKNSRKTASGERINVAADDAAGLAISEHFKASIRSIAQAQRNNHDGISIVQVAEGSLHAISESLIRLRELGVQAASDTVGNSERHMIDYEVKQMDKEIDRIARSAKWQGTRLLDGNSADFDFQVGVYNGSDERITYQPSKNDATSKGLGISGLNFSTKYGAQSSLKTLDNAITKISSMRSDLGGLQSRLTYTVDNLTSYNENISASESRIRDTDLAKTTADLTKDDILMKASTLTLAQANQNSSQALKLLG